MPVLLIRLLCACAALCLVAFGSPSVNAGFIVSARAVTIDGRSEDQQQGTSASTSVSQTDSKGSSASALVFGQPVWSAIMGGRVYAADEPNTLGATSARVEGTWTDTLRWTGLEPAPDQVFLAVTLDGRIDAALNPVSGRSAGGLARVRIDDHVTGQAAGNVSWNALVNSSIDAGFGSFSTSGSFALSKSSIADEYGVGIFFEAGVSAQDGWIELDTRNTFGFVDITLEDGTSVLDQIQFESGLSPTSPNPVPEPGSMALFSLGLVGLGAVRSKRGRRRETANPA